MDITNEMLEWSSEDTDVWRSFLETRTGKRLIPKILEATPELLSSGDVNAILIRSGEMRGVKDVVRQMLFLANPPKEISSEPASSYPSLVDDAKWSDGHTIQP